MFTLSAMISWAAFVLATAAAPLEERDSVAPPITNPKAGTVWTVGQHATVEWWAASLLVCRGDLLTLEQQGDG